MGWVHYARGSRHWAGVRYHCLFGVLHCGMLQEGYAADFGCVDGAREELLVAPYLLMGQGDLGARVRVHVLQSQVLGSLGV